MSVEHLTVDADEAGVRLDRWVKRRRPGLTQGRIEKLLRTGQIRVDGARAKSNLRLEAGQDVRLPPEGDAPGSGPSPRAQNPVSAQDAAFIRSLVIYEDDDLIALNKPPGLAVQGGSKTLRHIDGMAGALRPGGPPPKLIHRLDRDTSGVLALAKTPAAAAHYAKAFQSHRAEKTYWALTIGTPVPAQGLIKGFLRKAPAGRSGDRELMVAARHGEPGAVHARTAYGVVAQAGARAAWVALRPLTGRTHQLRVHMAMAGTPILGDGKYGDTDRPAPENLPKRLHLHAYQLVLPQRSRQNALTLTAPISEHMASSFAALGFDPRDHDALDPFQGVEIAP